MRKEPIVTGEYYHVFSRGVDRRPTYSDDDDRQRFLWGMIAFNDAKKRDVLISRLRCQPRRSATPLVKILCYAIMPNHYHFMLQQLVDGGIARFMQRLGRGYTAYFNRQNDRTGSLWESEYKAVRVDSDAQLLHVSRYIHLNPLKLFFPNWKVCGVPNWGVANSMLKNYRWSSYPHFLNSYRDEAVDTDILDDLFRGPFDYAAFMKEHANPNVRN